MEKKILMKLKSYDHRVLDQAVQEIIGTVQRKGGSISGPIPLPREIKKCTVLRSPHIDKKARDQFERRIFKRFLQVQCSSETLGDLKDLSIPSEVRVEIKT